MKQTDAMTKIFKEKVAHSITCRMSARILYNGKKHNEDKATESERKRTEKPRTKSHNSVSVCEWVAFA